MCRQFFLVGIAALLLAVPLVADETKVIDANKAQKAIAEQLEKYRAPGAQVMQVKDEALGKVFPRHLFFTAHFRQFPIARVVPEPLKAANIFAYSADGKLTLLNNPKALEKFFREQSAPVKEADQGKAAARAWLKLSPELQQDGFFRFAIVDDTIKVDKADDKLTASGKVIVMQGGNGEINARLAFADGKLVKIDETSKIRPGPRPICQATKLLDADPIVRKMAEQDLLYMGRAAKPYLDDQRAKASPELRKAIDRIWQRIIEQDR